MQKDNIMEKIISLAKRRGLVFQSSEIYGGLSGCYDFGPMGVEMLRNIKEEWWKAMTIRSNIEGLDSSILMHQRVWEASGHIDHFVDMMVDCRECKSRFRTDELNPEKPEQCPVCGSRGGLTGGRPFNLMFKTFIGPVENSSAMIFLRPETAQGIYVNYQNVLKSSRQKIPFGIAQIGKAFRNEINTRNFLYRIREFEQMEMQFFVKPGKDEKWFEYWRDQRLSWYQDLGIPETRIHIREVPGGERAHYAKRANDFEYEFPFGTNEVEGIHNRTDYDLSRHEQYSGKSMKYFDQGINERYIPYIIETSAGVTRSFLAFLCEAYTEEKVEEEIRIVLRLHPRLAPVKAAVFPLVKRDGMPEKACAIYNDLKSCYKTFYDEGGTIGRRYRRQDEMGTPFCVTVDHQTMEDDTVTVRDRDSMVQERITSGQLRVYLSENI